MPQIVCSGPHGSTVVLGTSSTTPSPNAGYLCADCQQAYQQLCGSGRLAAGMIPTRAQVDAALQAAGVARRTP